jgi:threonine dehydrogenase-like Zn-dependent dehydrogenase
VGGAHCLAKSSRHILCNVENPRQLSEIFKRRILMKALCWHGAGDVRVDNVPDPKIQRPGDVIIKITVAGICGSDLHLFDGYQPAMEAGDILGYENMGVSAKVLSHSRKV